VVVRDFLIALAFGLSGFAFTLASQWAKGKELDAQQAFLFGAIGVAIAIAVAIRNRWGTAPKFEPTSRERDDG
jgi:hypothetical protein